MRLQKINSALFIMLLAFSLLVGGLFSYKSAAALDNYDVLRTKWYNMLTGGTEYEVSNGQAVDFDVRNRINSINGAAGTYSNTLNRAPNRTYLWSDLASTTNSSQVTTSYSRLRGMALAFGTRGSRYYQDATFKTDIINALDWLDANRYNDTDPAGLTLGYDNWWDWEIGTPMALNDIVVLMYDALLVTSGGSQKIANYMAAVERFSPDPTMTGSGAQATGANRVWKITVVGVRGAVVKSSPKLEASRDAVSQIFDYVTSGDGFYTDGSFIQHAKFPYNGGYGNSLLSELADVVFWLSSSNWAVTDPDQQNIYQWVYQSYEPLIYKGAMMDMVRGREISRSGSQDHAVGQSALASIIRVSQFAPATDRQRMQAMIKYWIQNDTISNLYSSVSIDILLAAKQIMSVGGLPPRAELILSKVFGAMDRVVHLRPGWGFGLSMYSKRIANYESINNENLKAWYTADGMTYLYNADLGHYSQNFWPTVNSYRLPGTTVDTLTRTVQAVPKAYTSSKPWVGGVNLADRWSVAGMDFVASGDLKPDLTINVSSTLTARKSWFMLDNEVVALGAAINATNQSGLGWDGTARKVETIVENRHLLQPLSATLSVNNVAQPNTLGWSKTLTTVNTIHLTGAQSGNQSDIGYYFPGGGTSVNALREERSASWKEINGSGSTNVVTGTYLTLWFNHGVNPANATYSYVVLPGKSASQLQSYAANPPIEILANSSAMQAVKETQLGLVGANFWNDGLTTLNDGGNPYLSVNKKSSVLVRQSGSDLEIAVADPTQLNTGTIELEIQRAANQIVERDNEVTIVQLYPTLKISVQVNGAKGRSFKAKFKLGTSLVVTSPTDNGLADTTGTLSDAIRQANSGPQKTIVFQLTSGNKVQLNAGSLPTLSSGVTVYGGCGLNGPNIEIVGNGLTGPGFRLSGGVTLQGLFIRGFNGLQILANSGANTIACLRTAA